LKNYDPNVDIRTELQELHQMVPSHSDHKDCLRKLANKLLCSDRVDMCLKKIKEMLADIFSLNHEPIKVHPTASDPPCKKRRKQLPPKEREEERKKAKKRQEHGKFKRSWSRGDIPKPPKRCKKS
jgi:hypothetical protein